METPHINAYYKILQLFYIHIFNPIILFIYYLLSLIVFKH